MANKVEKINELIKKGKFNKILKYLNEADDSVRAAAYGSLAHVDAEESREYLRTGLRDNSPEVRLAVAEAIKVVGNSNLSEIVRRQILSETDENLKKALQEAEETCRNRPR